MSVTATIRMFRLQQLGDCFLLTFRTGTSRAHALIDCGTYWNSKASMARLREVTAAIAAALDGDPLDLVVGTHQHNDHLSGFVHCADAFRQLSVGQVWLSWLDDPADPDAQALGTRFHNLRAQVAAARDGLAARSGARPGAQAQATLATMNAMLGFFGAPEARTPSVLPAKAVATLKTLGQQPPGYLRPGETRPLPGALGTAVRVHVLGPPRGAALERISPRRDETYDPELAAASANATRFADAFGARTDAADEDAHYPFNKGYKRAQPRPAQRGTPLQRAVSRYRSRDEAWRTIDDDWLQQGDALALFLDTYTNNSSLALAIELVDSGKVLLFPADAQTGNWASWKDVAWQAPGVTTADLLARTVFYKAGHHASHNGTLPAVFEQLSRPDLVTLIPVDKSDPMITRQNGWRMPAEHLFARMVEKAGGRVLQMDGVDPPECDLSTAAIKRKWAQAGVAVRRTPLAIEVDISG